MNTNSFNSVVKLVNKVGVKVKLTSVDGSSSFNTTGAYASVKANPQSTGASVQQKSRIYVVAGRFLPQVGDFVDMNGQGYRVKSVDALSVQGTALFYVLDIT